MNSSNDCTKESNSDNHKNSCKCCLKILCDTNSLVSHIIQEHPKEVKNLRTENSKSEFLHGGVMLNDIKADPFFAFENFEFVKTGKYNKVLGAGAFGQVLLAKHKVDGNFYAIKKLDRERIANIGISNEMIYREIDIHLKLVHPNIARLYSYHEDPEAIYLILEYMDNGTLYNLIQKNRGMSEKDAFKYFHQVAGAFHFLHENNLIHRDLKPENCLVDSDHNVKICDFGWTVELSQGTRATFCGTYEYMAPEIVKEMPYNESIDVWSLGVLLYELIHSFSPFRVRINLIL